jgi:hypothetical protein
MGKIIYLALVVLVIMTVVSCDSGGGNSGYNAIRKVYEVSEENISGNGGYWDIPELENIGDYTNMPLVIVYGDKHSSGIEWHLITDYYTFCEEGKIYIDTGSGYSDFYRIVVVK